MGSALLWTGSLASVRLGPEQSNCLCLGQPWGALEKETRHVSPCFQLCLRAISACRLTSLTSGLVGRLQWESVVWMVPLNWWKHFCSGLCCVSVPVRDSWWWYNWTKRFTQYVSVPAVGKEGDLSRILCQRRLSDTVPIPPVLPPEAKVHWAWMEACFRETSFPGNLGVLGCGASLDRQRSSQGMHVGDEFQKSRASPAFPAQLWELGLAELGCSCRWVRRKGYVRWDWRRTRDAWVQRYQWEDPSGQVLSVQPASPSYARVFWAICSLTALHWHVEVGGRECTRGRLSFAESWPKLLSWLQQINKFLNHVKVMFNKLILHPRKFSPRISSTAEKSLGKYSLQWVALWFWDENSSWKASGCLLYGRAGKVPSSMRCCSCTASQLPMLSGCGSREAQEPAGRSCLRALQPCPATTIASLPQVHLCQQRGHCSLVTCAAVSVLGLLSDPVPLAVLVHGTVVAQQSNADHINIE